MSIKEKIYQLWNSLYPQEGTAQLDAFLQSLRPAEAAKSDVDELWYKDAIVYSLYVDLYARNFDGLTSRLDYLQGLGVNCLWLLPILDSPMRDAGFDIRNYDLIRHDMLGLEPGFSRQEQEAVFGKFLDEAHRRGIRVIFDIAINHCSEEHPWFQEALKGEDNPYRDYFIWSQDPSRYSQARIIFKGMEESNWEKRGEWYFFHRFFNFQPDLNYRNPKVLLAMSANMLYWQSLGVDGFRADAIPYLWKEEGTDCENLPQTHLLVKFFRAVLDYVRPGTILLAEACQKPEKVVAYMGKGDECQAAYHFPVMPMFYKAIARQSAQPIRHILSPEVTPDIPETGQWFTFLRCHDELSLELVYVSEEDRKYIHENYCHQPQWDFRLGEGISARLANLFQFDDRRIGLAYSMMLSLPGTPVIYYGDEFGKENDENFYREMIALTGKDDTRFLVRGKINWALREEQLKDPDTFNAKVFRRVQTMLAARKRFKAFGRGSHSFVDVTNHNGETLDQVLAYYRQTATEKLLIVQNLSDTAVTVMLPHAGYCSDLLSEREAGGAPFIIEPFGYHWFNCNNNS
ncbi:MAG: alpha-amylase [Bacteroidetes bacterium]|nr:alpha-amylase [Bacteroidota bacterium]